MSTSAIDQVNLSIDAQPELPEALPWRSGKRDAAVDLLRGSAVLLMIWGHLGIVSIAPPWPRWAQVIGGLAPVMFFFLAGAMVAYTAVYHRRDFRHFLHRAVMLLFMGALVDVGIFQIFPFTSVDVLYGLGLVLPLTYLVSHWPARRIAGLGMAVILATPPLQQVLGYTAYPLEWTLHGELVHRLPSQTSIFHHWLIDGWFPLFPWWGVALMGSFFAQTVLLKGFPLRKIMLIGGLGLLLGTLLWYPFPEGYSLRLQAGGVFMPPGVGYLMFATGCCWALYGLFRGAEDLVNRVSSSTLARVAYGLVQRPVLQLGRAPLLAYALHLLVIELFRHRYGKWQLSAVAFWAACAGLVLGIWLLLEVRQALLLRIRLLQQAQRKSYG